MTIETFGKQLAAATRAYEKYIVCLQKPPEDFHGTLESLMSKAIKAYENRPAGMRHGIALDRHVTIILSQNDGPVPLCGIYFNLHSPYQHKSLPSTVKKMNETASESDTDGDS